MPLIKPRLLVLAPHCDDAEFGLGAYLHRMRDEADIRVVIYAYGSYRNREGDIVSGIDRADEALKALARLGIDDVRFSDGFPENGALEVPYGNLVRDIEQEVSSYSPDETYICLPSFNQDHRALFDATITAFRPGNLRGGLYAYEYPGTEWAFDPPKWGKRYLTAQEDNARAKLEALLHHQSQFDGRKVAVGPTAAVIMLQQRGAEIGTSHAELVYTIREVR